MNCKKCGCEIDELDAICFDGQCFSCQIQEMEDKLSEALRNDEITETSHQDDIVCPWCGARIKDDLWEYGEIGAIKCDCCGKKFAYESETTRAYSTSRFSDYESNT